MSPDGTYVFDVELIESQIYLTEVEINGMSYQSEFAVAPAGASELVLEPIVVYSTTEDYNVLNLEEMQIYFDFASETPLIYSVYFFANSSEETLLVQAVQGEDIAFASFPEGTTGMGYETTNDSAPFISTGIENVFAMPPTETPYGLIAFATIPNSEEIQIKLPVKLSTDTITIHLPEGMTATGSTLTDGGIQNMEGTNFHIYTAAPVAQDGTLEFTLSGKPETVAKQPDITQNQTVLIGVGALGITLILAGVFMYLRDKKKQTEEGEEGEEDDDDDQLDDTESIMDAIIAIDELHRAGKISDEAYKKRREELTSALKRKG